jgi:hypothetical protein
MERESLEDRTLVSALDNAGLVVRFGSRRGAMDFCPNHDDATTSTSIYDFKSFKGSINKHSFQLQGILY